MASAPQPSPSSSKQSPPSSGNSSPPPPSQASTSLPKSSTNSPSAPEGESSSPSATEPSPSPPPSRKSSGSENSGDSRSKHGKKSSSLSSSDHTAAVIAGAVLGVVSFALLLAIAACVCCAKRKKKKHPPPMIMPFYTDEKGNVYYPNAGMPPMWQQYGSQSSIPGPPGWHQAGSRSPSLGPGSTAAPLSGEMYSSGPHGPPLPPPSPGVSLGFSKSSFSYEELAAATSGFSAANMLGQGGFGYVYKGVLAGSGKEVAVKQLKSGSGQGEREFRAEVEIISRVHHRHLVSLVGYCIAGSQRMLVYEFVPNNTMEHHLHAAKDVGGPAMDWSTRMKIALGSAKGLAYLHEDCHPRIIHRDIKAANILLDGNFEAMVADFGLAKLTTDTNTHVSTRVMGTFGYLAPEYASSGKLTDKSDVFSFGVMLLELLTGRRPIDTANYMEDSLVDWAQPRLAAALAGETGFAELVDARLGGEYSPVEVERMAACAAASTRHSAKRRPKMSQIVRALEGDASLEDLHRDGIRPGQSALFSAGGSENMSRLRQLAFDDSDDYTSDYSTDSCIAGLPPRRP